MKPRPIDREPPVAAPETTAIDPRVTAAARGDRQAAHELLRELLPRVRNLVRYLVREDGEVDDIAQQVLIEMLHSFGAYRGEGKLTGWTDRITVRVALRQIKRRREERQRQADAAPDLRLVRASQAGGEAYADRRDALKLLDALPQEQRQVVVLHHVAGLSVPELAQTLDVPFETARSRLRLALSKLRTQLTADGLLGSEADAAVRPVPSARMP